MRKTVTAGLLLWGCFQVAVWGSGPYVPPRVEPKRTEDLVYRIGQAVYSGEMKLGAGQSCANCHRGALAFKKGPLKEMSAQDKLKPQIFKCVTQMDRVNGAIDNSQMEAVVRFLSKRYKL
jgi:mono/diheme cytochrome c family protein